MGPVAEVAQAARERAALVHTDAAQSVGKVPVSVSSLGVEVLSVAGHKLYAPKGVGALFVRRGTPLRPFALGAGHERGLRPGTENVASIVGLGPRPRAQRGPDRAPSQYGEDVARAAALLAATWRSLAGGPSGT